MDDSDQRIHLYAIHVRWSAPDAAYVAWSEQYPGLVHTDPWSSLAAVDGLIEKVQITGTSPQSTRRRHAL
ncbi:hypothetical protein [Nocardia sp. IFM 10818]